MLDLTDIQEAMEAAQSNAEQTKYEPRPPAKVILKSLHDLAKLYPKGNKK